MVRNPRRPILNVKVILALSMLVGTLSDTPTALFVIFLYWVTGELGAEVFALLLEVIVDVWVGEAGVS